MGVLTGICKDKYFEYFEEICKIPHGSTNEREISQYLVDFAKEHNLYCRRDEMNNVFIKKAGSKGFENAPAVILQGHIDMVCEKEVGVSHDFLKDGLELYVKDDFIHAKGTTLGADNGMASGYILNILESTDLMHPPIEAIFTVEEEIGMGGADFFDVSDVEGKLFINLDSEEEGIILASCSGGRRMKVRLPIVWENFEPSLTAYKIEIGGLKGGHSGQEIHLQRANANCLMGRVLDRLEQKGLSFSLVSIDGGRLDNVICREAEAVIVFAKNDFEKVAEIIKNCEKEIQEEYISCDSSITISIEETISQAKRSMSAETKAALIDILLLLPYGVQTMSVEMQDLVESSNNIGVVKTTETEILFENAVRSSVASRKEVVCTKIERIAKRCGATVTSDHDYPGWKFNPQSKLLKTLERIYKEVSGKDAVVSAVHAGLECGLFGEKIEGLDMVSMGPEMYDVHTPNERLSISSTIRTWEFLVEILAQLARNTK